MIINIVVSFLCLSIFFILVYLRHLDMVRDGQAEKIEILEMYIHHQNEIIKDTIIEKDSIINELKDSIKQ